MTYQARHQMVLRLGFDRGYLTSIDFHPNGWLTKSASQTAMKLFLIDGLIKADEKVGGRFIVNKEKLKLKYGWQELSLEKKPRKRNGGVNCVV